MLKEWCYFIFLQIISSTNHWVHFAILLFIPSEELQDGMNRIRICYIDAATCKMQVTSHFLFYFKKVIPCKHCLCLHIVLKVPIFAPLISSFLNLSKLVIRNGYLFNILLCNKARTNLSPCMLCLIFPQRKKSVHCCVNLGP